LANTPDTALKLPLALFISLTALLYNQIQPPPAKIPGTPGGPPVTANRTTLRDGRHLAYLESGVPQEKAKYKIIYVHGFDCCRYDRLNVSQVQYQLLYSLVSVRRTACFRRNSV
jgi:hypothetical protein